MHKISYVYFRKITINETWEAKVKRCSFSI